MAIDLENSPWFVPISFGVLALGVIYLFSEFLFSNLMLHGSDMIPAGVFHRQMYIEFFNATGRVLQWNPYVFGGMPYVEAFHGDIFYPLSILKFFGSIYRKFGFSIVLHVYLSGLFMYFTARQFNLRKISSLLAATGYMFSPYFISMVAPGHEGKIYVTALFPLVILFANRGFNSRPWFNFSMVGLVIGLCLLTPHAQMSYFTLWALALYSAFRLINIWRDSRSLARVIKPGLLVSYAVLIGLALSAIQFYPGYVYTSNFSPRAYHKSGYEWATSWSMHPEEAMALLIPEFPGVSTRKAETNYWGKNAFKDNSEAVGSTIFFMALLGFLFYRKRESWFFGGLAIFALLYALADTTPLFRLFFLIPKVESMRAASMIMFLFSFSSCLLAGMGLEHLFERRANKEVAARADRWFTRVLWGFPGLLLLLALAFSASGKGMLDLWCSIFYSEAFTTMVQKGVSRFDYATMNLPAITSGAWWAFLATGLTAGLIWMYQKGKTGAAIFLGLIAIVLLSDLRFDSRFIGTADQNKIFSPSAMSTFFKGQEGKFRVHHFEKHDESMLPYNRVEVVVGYHGNQVTWYDDLIGGLSLANVGSARAGRAPNPNVMNLLGMKYLVMNAQRKLPPTYFGDRPISAVAAYGQLQVLQNDNAFPRVYLAGSYRLFDNRKAVYPAVVAGEDDLRHVAYLEKAPSLEPLADSTGSDSAWIISYEPERIVVGISAASNKLLVLTDTYYDAWHARVDGQPSEILRTYGALRAVAIPAGASEVEFWFESERYATGKMVSLLTVFYLFSIVGFQFVSAALRKKKEKQEKEDEEVVDDEREEKREPT